MHDVFFFTDLHGHYQFFNFLKNWCYKQDSECTIVYGGDAADRGNGGYRIMKELLSDKHFVYLKGNHEDLFVKAADRIIGKYASSDEKYHALHHCTSIEQIEAIIVDCMLTEEVLLHIQNGGYSTLRDWLMDGANEDIIEQLRQLHYTYSYNNIDFSHAGSLPYYFESVSKDEFEGKIPSYHDSYRLIWDRESLPVGWTSERICVFGHTPTIHIPAAMYGSRDLSVRNIHPAMWQDQMGARKKRSGWKIDMDTGIIWSDRAFVLNCTTMTMYGFQFINDFTTIPIEEPTQIKFA